LFGELRDLQLDFNEQSLADLESEYNARQGFAELNLRVAKEAFGKESAEYEKAVFQRLALERNFQNEKLRLAELGAKQFTSLGNSLITVFQGQNKTLFAIGKALAIADTTITGYQAAARAYKDFPYPFNIAIAAIQLALVAGQIAKISSISFNPEGFKAGSMEPLTTADLVQTVFVHPEIVRGKIGKFAGGSIEPLKTTDVIKTIFVHPEIISGKVGKFAEGSAEPLTPANMLQSFAVNYQLLTAPAPQIPDAGIKAPQDKNFLQRIYTRVIGEKIGKFAGGSQEALQPESLLQNVFMDYLVTAAMVPDLPDADISAPADKSLLQRIFLDRKFAEGSSRPLSPVDVIQSVFTPPGESGLVAVQTGEFIMNRKATREFSDVLRAMNAGQFQRPVIQRFQQGGAVGQPSPTPASAPNVMTVQDLQEIVRAIENVQINIRAELDAMEFFKENFSKFEKNRNERRIF
jgi:hypothetical protein